MSRKAIIRDLVGLWVLLTGCLVAGVVLNEVRPTPLPIIYSSPQARLDQSVKRFATSSMPAPATDGDVTLEQVQRLTATRSALILDARPEVFFRLGHIPSALSLPRDDFEKQYQALRTILLAHRDEHMVVYCSSSECHDSRMVLDALEKLGFQHLQLFRGGWSDWENANLPEEKE